MKEEGGLELQEATAGSLSLRSRYFIPLPPSTDLDGSTQSTKEGQPT